jgi:hypothetical protein
MKPGNFIYQDKVNASSLFSRLAYLAVLRYGCGLTKTVSE